MTADSTEVGRIVPIYEAIGAISSRMIRRMVHAALENLIAPPHRSAARRSAARATTSRRAATPCASCISRRPTMSVEALNAFRSPAHQRLIFEEFFFYQLSIALRRQRAAHQHGHRLSRARAAHPRSAQAHSALQAHRRAEARARGNCRRSRAARAHESPAARRRRQRQNHRGARSRDHRDRKRLSGGADGAHGNSGRAAFPFRAADLRARGLSRGAADQRPASPRKSARRIERVRTGEAQARRRHARAARRPRAPSPSWAW